MNFDFSEDHRVIQDQIRRFLSDKSPLARFRDVLECRDVSSLGPLARGAAGGDPLLLRQRGDNGVHHVAPSPPVSAS